MYVYVYAHTHIYIYIHILVLIFQIGHQKPAVPFDKEKTPERHGAAAAGRHRGERRGFGWRDLQGAGSGWDGEMMVVTSSKNTMIKWVI